jgi:vacuolar-type H+-ATPase subunit D/Vma8
MDDKQKVKLTRNELAALKEKLAITAIMLF